MRHNKKFNHLSRTASHRASLFSNMAVSLFKFKRITTTVAKAKALRKYVEPLITKAKPQGDADMTPQYRVVFSYLQDKNAVKELFGNIGPKVAERQGGYTRIIKLGSRKDDGAQMCFIELVDFDENMMKAAPKKTRRTRRSKKVAEAPVAEPVAEPAAEVVEEVKEAE